MSMQKGTLGRAAETFSTALVILTAWACSASSSSGVAQQSSNGVSSTSGGTGASPATGSQPGFVYTDASATNGGSTSTDAQLAPCAKGDECVCATLTVAVIGTPGKWGANSNSSGQDSDTAFQDWLNSSSAGTAKVDNYTTKPTLTADFLTRYNVIVLAGLGDDSNVGPWWTFDATEISSVADWVTAKGGGLISLSGYSGDGGEVDAKNALFAFSGIQYNKDGVAPPCKNLDANNAPQCWCAGGNCSTVSDWNRTDPVVANLSLGVTLIGIDNGRSIVAPTGAHVAAFMNNGATNLLVGKIVGQGRVLAYSDEWITYTSQWSGIGNPNTANPACAGYLPQDKYQTAQFWYNMIRWTQPNATCFKIEDKQQPVNIW